MVRDANRWTTLPSRCTEDKAYEAKFLGFLLV